MPDYVDAVASDLSDLHPELDVSPIEVVARILRAAQVIQSRLDSVVATDRLSHKGDLDTLTALRRSEAGRLKPSALAQMLQMTSGGMTNRLDRLEESGLVVRQPDPADRRAVNVVLTPAGRSLADEVFQASISAQDEIVSSLTARERSALAAHLRTLLISLDDTPVEAG